MPIADDDGVKGFWDIVGDMVWLILCPIPRVIPWVIPWGMGCWEGMMGMAWLWGIPDVAADCPILCGMFDMAVWFMPGLAKAVVEPHPD